MCRCVNDIFAYCENEPEGNTEEETQRYTGLDGKDYAYKTNLRQCPRDPKNCPQYRTFADSLSVARH